MNLNIFKSYIVCLAVFVSCGRTNLKSLENPHGAIESQNIQLSHQIKSRNEFGCQVENASILFSVDNSSSMRGEQDVLRKNFNTFLNHFLNAENALKWKLALVSSDENDLPYIGTYNKPFVSYDSNLKEHLILKGFDEINDQGVPKEKFKDIIFDYLNDNPSFFEGETCLYVFIISDTVDFSENFRFTSPFLELIRKRFPNIYDLKFFVAIDYFVNDGSLTTLANQTNGEVLNIHQEDFGKKFAEIGKKLFTQNIAPIVLLSDRPNLMNLKVSYLGRELRRGGQPEYSDYYYDPIANTIVFYHLNFAPEDNATVLIEF